MQAAEIKSEAWKPGLAAHIESRFGFEPGVVKFLESMEKKTNRPRRDAMDAKEPKDETHEENGSFFDFLLGRRLTPEEQLELDRGREKLRAENERDYAKDAEWARWSFAAQLNDMNDPARILTVWRFPSQGLRDEFVSICATAGVDETGDDYGDAGLCPQCGIFPVGRAFVRRKLVQQGVWRDARHSGKAEILKGAFTNYDGFYRGPELPGQVPPVCEVATMGIVPAAHHGNEMLDCI